VEQKEEKMEEFNSAVAEAIHPAGTSMHSRQFSVPSSKTIRLGDVQREHRELFTWLAYYNHSVAKGVGRNHLLAIFDATFKCVKKHFRSVEALLEQTAWPRFHHHYEIHTRLTEDLADYRSRLAGNGPLDEVECAHVLDALLIHYIREQPMFIKLYRRLNNA
jgi:hemerythrin-like metal-binding protein